MVGVALELVPLVEDMLGSDTPQGNTEHLRTCLPGELPSPIRLELADKVSRLPLKT